MTDQVFGLVEEIRNGKNIYFSFVFRNYYLKTGGDSDKAQNLAWDSEREARSAYDAVEAVGDRDGVNYFGIHGLITIRHIDETKGRPRYRKIAYAYGVV